MRKIMIFLACIMLLTGCAPTTSTMESKYEIYSEGYSEGYNDALDAVINEMPWSFIDKEELVDALYQIFDNDEYAEEVRDQILSYCELFERQDYEIDYSDLGIDYNFD